MVEDENVIVGLSPDPVGVCNHKAVGVQMHILGQLVTQIVDLLDVLRVLPIEFPIRKTLPVVGHLNLTPMGLSQSTAAKSEHAHATEHIGAHGRHTFITYAPDIHLSRNAVSAGTVVRGAHRATLSPNS